MGRDLDATRGCSSFHHISRWPLGIAAVELLPDRDVTAQCSQLLLAVTIHEPKVFGMLALKLFLSALP
jgi:hypothetical protein